MAAFDTPWLSSMSPPSPRAPESGSTKSNLGQDPNPPTVASFSPGTSSTSPANRKRGTVIVQQKSPLLVATPPQITRALAFSHPFVLTLNKLAGLVSWTSGDPWESFLLVAGFWIVASYGDAILRLAGPLMVVVGLILGMYSRRYSPLSSTGFTGEKVKGHKREDSEGLQKHRKSLDEIVDTLNVFTSRCNVLLEPLLQLTDFLSTQRTATSATTRPALTTLFIRILLVTPVWIGLTLSPIYLITSRRVILSVGTILLTWHSRPARVSRTILWRSLAVRYVVSLVTGLSFSNLMDTPPMFTPRRDGTSRATSQHDVARKLAVNGRDAGSGVRFTFVVYENQRRWLGLGWTASLLAYERAPWTDEHLNKSTPKERFQLPDVEGDHAKWQWVGGSEWRVEGTSKSNAEETGKTANDGWIYYDNKWSDGRRSDGWGRYTRRRKWFRDAELIELPPISPYESQNASYEESTTTIAATDSSSADPPPNYSQVMKESDDAGSSQARRRGFFGRGNRSSARTSSYSGKTGPTSDDDDDHRTVPEIQERNGDWGVGDDVKMGFG